MTQRPSREKYALQGAGKQARGRAGVCVVDSAGACLIDTHAHLTFPEFDKDRADVMKRAWDAGIEHIVTIGPGDGIDGDEKAVALAASQERIFATVGVHPHDAAKMTDEWLVRIEELAREKKVVAIGEIGLDYHYRFAEPEVQRNRFREQILLAARVEKPIVIHDREAHDDVWKVIEEAGVSECGGVFHCFSGDVEFARRVVDAGFYISIPGVVTFNNAKRLQEVVAEIPLERIVIETDCPFLAPDPYRGKRNEPAYVVRVAEKIAAIKGLTIDDVARVTTLAAKRLFDLPGAEMEPHVAYRIRNSLYLNITNRCNNACRFCPKFTDFEVKGYYLKLEHEPGVDEVFLEVGRPEGYDEVVFCGYGEPTLRLEVLKLIAQRMKGKGAKKLRLNTDGLANLVYGRNIVAELKGLIDSVSVSLNAPDAATYAKFCPSKFGEGAYDAICAFIVEAKKYIPEVAASVVALPDLDIEACRRKAAELGVPLRIREYMNVG